MRLSAIRCSRKRTVQFQAHGIEKALNVRINHPVHLFPVDPGMESVQRIMLATPRPKPVGKPDEVLLIDSFQNIDDRLLGNLVLQAEDTQMIVPIRPAWGYRSALPVLLDNYPGVS